MSFIGDIFSGAKGAGFQAGSANIVEAANKEQADAAYKRAQEALDQQNALVAALGAQGGIQKQSDVYNQYAGLAQGTGPSLAQAQLQQATGANIANQAALAAGQRGAGANVGLMARQAAQAGGGLQQQAIGQLSQLRAQEQLAALGQQAGLATQMVGQQTGATQNYGQQTQSEQQNILNAIAQANNAKVAQQSNINNTMAEIAKGNQAAQQGMLGMGIGALGSVGAAIPGLLKSAPAAPLNPSGVMGPQLPGGQFYSQPGVYNKAHGGVIEKYAEGGEINGPRSFAGKFLSGKPMLAHGGAPVVGEQLAAQGKLVPGHATTKGDSYKNDTVDAKLSPGEIVIPRSIAQAPDAPKKAAEFVNAVLAKQNMKNKKK